MNLEYFLSEPWRMALTLPILALCIPIVAIIMGGINSIVKKVIKHRERMALIDRGIHPEYPPDDEDPGGGTAY